MDTIAFQNLKILNKKNDDTTYLIADGSKLSLISKDDFDPINKVGSLEYPIYFTYHHILNIIGEDKSIAYVMKKYLLEDIETSLYTIAECIEDYNEEDNEDYEILLSIIHEINIRYDSIREKTLYKKCENLIYLFDDLIEGFRKISHYLYVTDYNIIHDISDTSDDELQEEEERNFEDITFEGVSYLEYEFSGQIFTTDCQLVGKWNGDCDDIIWIDESARLSHENQKDKVD